MNKDQTIQSLDPIKQEKEILNFARLDGKKFDYLIYTQSRTTMSWNPSPLRRDIA
ncbi:hypothetical protein ACU3L3_18820 [Priestia endophytica]|uniref:hypothetical protein n=1 Tax=Priestia endophytica TaxID=135735 RepID=UPI0013799E61|nr:hypothetical protein [Priestia endophytica]